ncbi:hypothetical protein NDU88_003389 [Pleurodeles waltl]|uniref:Uncharacterized protein n=1 Tax=Pleurodeles waltl TaxID=8319 RepID=A0AAV7TR52_PLEWA|nr:hypothetical protein NDU88_003389 [Pleurodeles waltl]
MPPGSCQFSGGPRRPNSGPHRPPGGTRRPLVRYVLLAPQGVSSPPGGRRPQEDRVARAPRLRGPASVEPATPRGSAAPQRRPTGPTHAGGPISAPTGFRAARALAPRP